MNMFLDQIAAKVAVTTAEAASTNPVGQLMTTFHVDWERFSAQVLAFLIVFVMLYLLAWKPVLKVMDARSKKIADGLQYAEEMQQKLADSEQRQAAMMKEVALEAKRISEDAQARAKELLDHAAAESSRKGEELLVRTREALELERKQMMNEVRDEVTRLVAVTAERVLQRELKDDERSRYAAASLEEMTRN